jgi:hypothetical protein
VLDRLLHFFGISSRDRFAKQFERLQHTADLCGERLELDATDQGKFFRHAGSGYNRQR